jgi:glycosyltransferase involved in cell wall biosynthesis
MRESGATTKRSVLLFSPVAGLDPPSGDIAYTEALLAQPPPGITYTTYPDAIDAGAVRVRGRRPRHGGFRGADAAVLGIRAGEQLLRRSGAMFREPTWFVTIDPDAFDLVHQHLFPVRQMGRRLPVVSSAGYPLSVLYGIREGWSPNRLRVALALQWAFDSSLRVHDPWLRPEPGGVMTVWSGHFRAWLLGRGVPADRVLVAGTGLPDMAVGARRSDGRTLAFVGRDFDRKGGDVALASFQRLRATDPALHLIVVTSRQAAQSNALAGPGIELIVDAPRRRLLDDVLPRTDVLLLPTRSDCGAPFGVLEALQSGAAVVTSTDPWLDERLVRPAVVRVAATVDAVTDAARELLAPAALRAAQAAARPFWEAELAMDALQQSLLAAYARAGAGVPT